MRLARRLGLLFVLTGLAISVATSGAFESTSAERGVAVDVADDEDALVGLTYPDATDRSGVQTVELESDNADVDGGCLLFVCVDFEYHDVALLDVTDNTPRGELTVDEPGNAVTGDDVVSNLSWDAEARSVTADVECPPEPEFAGSTQQAATATVTFSIAATDGTLTVEADRTVAVQCVAD